MSSTGDKPNQFHQDVWVKRQGLALLTDWYQLTMMGGYHHQGLGTHRVCFEYFFRELPPHNGFAVFAGLDALLDYFENLRFEPDDIEFLGSTKTFPDSFLDSLKTFKMTCDVWAVPEGTVVFPHEPLVRVEGPLFQAQLLETFLLNALNYPTLVATKAARICQVAGDDPVIEFGLRRAQGPDGGLVGSRAAYIGGCAATSNALAGKHYGVPVKGTMAHSWVMAFPSELEAFRAYVKAYPQNPILLVDTYDTIESGVPNAIRVFQEMRSDGNPQRVAIRLDSGDLARLSKEAYEMIRSAGFSDPMIVASNELDDDLIADLKRQGAKINSWGVGTNLITCKGAPALSGVYKLVAIEENGAWIPRLKLSSNPAKATDPGAKRLIRFFGVNDVPLGDIKYLTEEGIPEDDKVTGGDREHFHTKYRLKGIERHEDLLEKVIENGHRSREKESLEQIRRRAMSQIEKLPEEMKRLRFPHIYTVALSPRLAEMKERLMLEKSQRF